MDTPTLEDAFDRLKRFCDRHSVSDLHSKMSMVSTKLPTQRCQWCQLKGSYRTNLYRDGMLVPMLTEAGAISAKAGTTSA
ncbi:unnamed protein product [Brassica rapa subsp. trilocularis]